MENIKEYIHLLNNRYSFIYTDEEAYWGKSNKMKDLYLGIKNDLFESDKAAAQSLYNDSPESTNYKKLKYRLHKKVLNQVLLIDWDKQKASSTHINTGNCWRSLSIVECLLSAGQRKLAIPLAEKTIKSSIKYDLTFINLALAKRLRGHYGAIIGNLKKYHYYNGLVHKYEALISIENLAHEYYDYMAIFFSKKRATTKEVSANCQQMVDDLRDKSEGFDSYRLRFQSNLVYTMYYEMTNNSELLIASCDDMINYFRERKYISKAMQLSFLVKKISVLILEKKYEEGKKVIDICLEILNEGMFNWFIILEMQLFLAFYTQNYQEAYETYIKAVTNNRFKKLFKNKEEKWKIYDAMINYFIRIEKIKPIENIKTALPPFKLSRFLNEVPINSKSKEGLNITIQVIQVLFLLQQKNYGKLIDKSESLKVYNYRYLNKKDTVRSSYFFKMILTLVDANFHRQAVIRKTGVLLKKLQNPEINMVQKVPDVEIVPYENLWPLIIDNIEDKFYYPRNTKENK